jgi:hypothetical protein
MSPLANYRMKIFKLWSTFYTYVFIYTRKIERKKKRGTMDSKDFSISAQRGFQVPNEKIFFQVPLSWS